MKNPITSAVIGPDGKPVQGLQGAILKAVGVQRPLVLAYLRRLRRKQPTATAAELARQVERDYLLAVTGTGAAVGATAAVPGIGTVTSLGLSAAATVGFLEASALYAQSLAELHGITTENPDKSRTLVMAILMGDEGSSLIASLTNQAAGKGVGPVKGWGAMFGNSQPGGVWGGLAGQVQKRFLRKMLATQGASMLGRAVPFGVGAAIGGVGNRFLGRKVVDAAALAFGPLPTTIPGEVTDASDAPSEAPGMVRAGKAGSPSAAGGPRAEKLPATDAAQRAAADVERSIEEERARRGQGGGAAGT